MKYPFSSSALNGGCWIWQYREASCVAVSLYFVHHARPITLKNDFVDTGMMHTLYSNNTCSDISRLKHSLKVAKDIESLLHEAGIDERSSTD
jgi:hypothetical protein